MTLYLSESEVRTVANMDLALEAVDSAFRGLAAGAVNHSRARVPLPHGLLHYMAAADPALGVTGGKLYATTGQRVDFLVPLFDLETGALLALIAADWLGQLRTGAASGVATRYLARADARLLGLIGTGGQARTQLLAACAVRPIDEVRVYSRSQERCAAFVHEMQPKVTARLIPVDSPRAAVVEADIVVTMTSSAVPVFDGQDLTPGVHINAAGSNQLRRREIDALTVRRADVITVDWLDQARLECGDLAAASAEGAFSWERAVNLHEVIAGLHPGRTEPGQITLFESQGLAIWDIALAARVLAAAQARGLGRRL
jgi:ornithine cyclodeaminase/alanine dehydrogenase-like protein (mu-crystallin family)